MAPGPLPGLRGGVAFSALAQIIRQRLAIAEDDPGEQAARKLAEGLDNYIPDPASGSMSGCG